MKTKNDTYHIPQQSNINRQSVSIANAVALELIQYGVHLSDELFEAICYADAENAMDLGTFLQKEYTVGKLNPPLFRNWEQRTSFTFSEFIIQILGYHFQISGNDLQDENYFKTILPNLKSVKNKTLHLASKDEAEAQLEAYCQVQVGQDKKTLEQISKLGRNFGSYFKHRKIANYEVKMALLHGMPNLLVGLQDLNCKPIDALRYAATKKDFTYIKLPADTKYASLTWKERIQLLSFLDSFDFDFLSEGMAINQECWKRFFMHVHLFSQKEFVRFFTVQISARVMLGHKFETFTPNSLLHGVSSLIDSGAVELLPSDNTVYRSFASRVASAIADKDMDKLLTICGNRPEYVLRNLATVSHVATKKNEAKFVDFVRQQLSKTTADNLFSILQLDVNADYRVIDIKGNTVIEPAKYPAVIKDIQGDIVREIRSRWGKKGQVFVHPSLKDKVVPFLSKTSELGRGTRIKVDKQRYLYFFTHWVQKNYRTDLDLSFVMFDADWKSSLVWFRDQANKYIAHSGDFTNAPAPNGATEYGRIELDNIPSDIKYIFPITNVYAGDVFKENKEAYSGFNLSDSASFALEQSNNRYSLDQPANSNIPFYYDVDKREIVVLDFNNRERMGMTAHSEIENMKKLIKAVDQKPVVTMGVLAEILSGEETYVETFITPKKSDDFVDIEPSELAQLFV